jgi:hypothetical protein
MEEKNCHMSRWNVHGNGRSFLPIKAKGVQWAQGAVSTAEWTGTPLAEVLALARLEKMPLKSFLIVPTRAIPKKRDNLLGRYPSTAVSR